MTRINLIDPCLLCDQHLLAEHRELTRIPNKLDSGKTRLDLSDLPANYTVRTNDNPQGGKGHERFFINKLTWLENRYHLLIDELARRGFKHENRWPASVNRKALPSLYNGYLPHLKDKTLNFKRIVERTPKVLRYNKQHSQDHYESVSIK